MDRNQYWAGRVYDLCVYYMTGTPEGSTESGFLEKPGIEPATPGLQGIALIHYTTGALATNINMPIRQERNKRERVWSGVTKTNTKSIRQIDQIARYICLLRTKVVPSSVKPDNNPSKKCQIHKSAKNCNMMGIWEFACRSSFDGAEYTCSSSWSHQCV